MSGPVVEPGKFTLQWQEFWSFWWPQWHCGFPIALFDFRLLYLEQHSSQ